MYTILDKINSPEDIKNLSDEEILVLAKDIRKFLINNVSKTGGHLASNLGVVELTLALHKIFDTSKDRIIFDVGHQSYVHKILTGRKDKFPTLRQFEGLSGFPKTGESIHDAFNTGHSSTSISAAIGMALAREYSKEDYEILALIGDGSLGSGVSLEGLNYLGNSKLNVTVILNDNTMSIMKNVGGISRYLTELRMTSSYRKLSKNVKHTLESVPLIGKSTAEGIKSIKDSLKTAVVPGAIFEKIGLYYYGPVDGHDFKKLCQTFQYLKKVKGPKLLHVTTTKGMGYTFSQKYPERYHGVGPFEIDKLIEPSKKSTFSKAVGTVLEDVFEKNDNAYAISAAMISGTGIENLQKKYKDRVIDVGIAESNAVTMSAGMAIKKLKPYVLIYSTFLQRAYDQILHDVCLQNLPVTFLIDRAGVVGEDGETHNGLYDLSYLIPMPNMRIYAPKDAEELERIINYTKDLTCPVAIRYPRGEYNIYPRDDYNIDKWEKINDGTKVCIITFGRMVELAIETRDLFKNNEVGIYNARVIKPIDKNAMKDIVEKYDVIVIIEDGSYLGGFNTLVSQYLNENMINDKILYSMGFPDEPIEHGKVKEIYNKYGFESHKLSKKLLELIELSYEKKNR